METDVFKDTQSDAVAFILGQLIATQLEQITNTVLILIG